jgi:hypothetical protein
MSIKRISNTGLTGLKYTVFNAGNTPISDVPDAPTIGTATAGAGLATVTYTAAATGGAATTFTATSSPGSLTGSSSSSPITVSSLTAGTAYTFTVVASNSTGSSPASGASNSVTPTSSDTGAMFPLGMVQVGSAGASTISFTSIPSTYKHLQIRVMARGTSGSVTDNWYLQLNSDTAANYSQHFVYGNGSTTGASGSANLSSVNMGLLPSNGNLANAFGLSIVDILDYASTTKYKTMRALSGYDNNGSDGYSFLYSSNWRSTSAISSIQITPVSGSGSFAQYSQFALYGIKGA